MAQPLRMKLQSWYSNLPEIFHIKNTTDAQGENSRLPRRDGVAVLQFCYLMAQILLYRALLRTITPSPPVAIIAGDDEDNGEHDYLSWIDQTSWQDFFLNSHDFGQLPPASSAESGVALEAVLNTAEKCGAIMTHFIKGLAHEDFDALWYGCKLSCFQTFAIPFHGPESTN